MCNEDDAVIIMRLVSSDVWNDEFRREAVLLDLAATDGNRRRRERRRSLGLFSRSRSTPTILLKAQHRSHPAFCLKPT